MFQCIRAVGISDYPTFVKAMERSQMHTFLGTSKGRNIAMNTTSKRQAALENKSIEKREEIFTVTNTPAAVTVSENTSAGVGNNKDETSAAAVKEGEHAAPTGSSG